MMYEENVKKMQESKTNVLPRLCLIYIVSFHITHIKRPLARIDRDVGSKIIPENIDNMTKYVM